MSTRPAHVEFLTLDYKPAAAGEEHRFGFECPKEPGKRCSGLMLADRGHDITGASWHWNGNREKPTFTPSINCKDCSHGYITDGMWKDC